MRLIEELDRHEQEARIVEAWYELHRIRMERLVGCLSTPVSEPTE
jgi:hypothetical protein